MGSKIGFLIPPLSPTCAPASDRESTTPASRTMMLQKIKRAGLWLMPEPKKSADGRDQWPSRAAFLLAAMGGCAGQGNLLRYPSVVYNNYGLQ